MSILKPVKEKNRKNFDQFFQFVNEYTENKKKGFWRGEVSARNSMLASYKRLPKYEKQNIDQYLNNTGEK